MKGFRWEKTKSGIQSATNQRSDLTPAVSEPAGPGWAGGVGGPGVPGRAGQHGGGLHRLPHLGQLGQPHTSGLHVPGTQSRLVQTGLNSRVNLYKMLDFSTFSLLSKLIYVQKSRSEQTFRRSWQESQVEFELCMCEFVAQRCDITL